VQPAALSHEGSRSSRSEERAKCLVNGRDVHDHRSTFSRLVTVLNIPNGAGGAVSKLALNLACAHLCAKMRASRGDDQDLSAPRTGLSPRPTTMKNWSKSC